jgi:hypothetical protein
MYCFKKGINSTDAMVGKPVAIILKGSVSATPVRFMPISRANTFAMLQKYI